MNSIRQPGKPNQRTIIHYSRSVSLSYGAINVFQLLSKLCSLPFHFLKNVGPGSNITVTVESNENYNSLLKWFFRNTVVLHRILLLLFAFGRLIWLKAHWQAENRMEQFFVYMIQFCMISIATISYLTLHAHQKEIMFILNQRFKLVPIQRNPHSRRKSMGDLTMYQFAIGCCAFPLLLFLLPLKLDYQMGPLIFYHLTGLQVSSLSVLYRIPTQLALGVYRAITEGYATCYFVSIFMVAIMFVEGTQNKLNPLVINTGFAIKFRQTLKLYRITQILLSQANVAIEKFVFGLVFLGVIFAGWCAYGTLMMKNDLPLLAYLTCPVIVCIALFVDFVLIYFASIPNRNSDRFQTSWKLLLEQKEDNRSLKSCCPLGFNIGPIKRVKLFTSLTIADCILNCAVNLVLVKLHSS